MKDLLLMPWKSQLCFRTFMDSNMVKLFIAKRDKHSDLISFILQAKPSKREAQSYLNQYQAPNLLAFENKQRQKLYKSLDKTCMTMGKSMTATISHDNTMNINLVKTSSVLDSFPINSHVNPTFLRKKTAILCLDTHLDDGELDKVVVTVKNLQKLGLSMIILPFCQRRNEANSNEWNKNMAYHYNLQLANKIDGAGGRAMPIAQDILGEINKIYTRNSLAQETQPIHCSSSSLKIIQTAFKLDQIPILLPFTRQHEQIVPMDLSESLSCLAKKLNKGPSDSDLSKVIVIHKEGGFYSPSSSKHYKFINLKEEYHEIIQDLDQNGVQSQSELLITINQILSILEPTASAILTSPEYASSTLITNLITDKPFSEPYSKQTCFNSSPLNDQHLISHEVKSYPSTLLRRGLAVNVETDISRLHLPKLNALLEKSFDKTLNTNEFWERISNVSGSFVLAGDYDGAAIITHEPDLIYPQHGFIPYLDKFSVSPVRQGMGVADILWKRIKEKYSDLVWRSRIDNPVNKWYFDRSDGNCILAGNYWMLFWYGEKGLSRLESYREMALSIPASFISPSIKYSK